MKPLDQDALIKTAVDAVLSGARIAEAAKATQVVATKGNLRDVVTQADLDVSALLEQKLSITGIPVISEERDYSQASTPDTFWAVDPIDGTANFAHGLAQYAVCAGLVVRNEFELGVVCAPSIDELYFTLGNGRSVLNGRPISHVHSAREDALCAASFSPKAAAEQYEVFRKINESTRGCLRTGSAALNICWAAAGKLQLAYGFDAKIWDVAAAIAVAKAANCKVHVQHTPGSLTLHYCIGSQDAVDHLITFTQSMKLWA
jgi:myo-inositol-1(or 4)-monophosphatase